MPNRLSGSLLALTVAFSAPGCASSEPLTPELAIETTRFQGESSWGMPIALSPNGKRYAIALLTGDVERDGNILTIMTGETNSLYDAIPVMVTEKFGRNLGNQDSLPKSNLTVSGPTLRWINEDNLAFTWEDDQNEIQVYTVNVETGEETQLTDHPTSVYPTVMDFGPNGSVLYAAPPNLKKEWNATFETMVSEGFTVEHDDAFAVMESLPNGVSLFDSTAAYEWFYRETGETPQKISIAGRPTTLWPPRSISISPNGRFAITRDFPEVIDPSWVEYSGSPGDRAQKIIESEEAPKSWNRAIFEYFVIDLETKTTTPLWNALAGSTSNATWSPDSSRLLVGPTFLPTEIADQSGLDGLAFVDIELETREASRLPLNLSNGLDIRRTEWMSETEVEIVTKEDRFYFEKIEGEWHASSSRERVSESGPRVELKIQSDLNTPPVLVGTDTVTGETRKLFDPNPELIENLELGRVQSVEWTAQDGRGYEGRLFLPVDYEPGTKYPFVIQNYAVQDTFSLYGFPEGTGLATGSGIFIAQMLAGQNIGVLQTSPIISKGPAESDEGGRAVMESRVEHVDSARRWLVENGYAYEDRVGLVGFSVTGAIAKRVVTHSDFVYAAAIIADNIEIDYLESTFVPGLTNWANGGPAFGTGLESWLELSPSFNVDRIYTPISKMHFTSGEMHRLAPAWEFFSRLRQLDHPVEFYVMPDARDHGAHSPQNPRQVAAIQNRTLDWWLFWLKDEEDPDPAKAEQYESWRKLREQRDELWKTPRPPKLDWSVVPVENEQP